MGGRAGQKVERKTPGRVLRITSFANRGHLRTVRRMPTAVPARYPALLGLLLITFAAAVIGSWVTFQSVREWYPTLAKPTWTPPSAVFGPVWSVLYVTMAAAA